MRRPSSRDRTASVAWLDRASSSRRARGKAAWCQAFEKATPSRQPHCRVRTVLRCEPVAAAAKVRSSCMLRTHGCLLPARTCRARTKCSTFKLTINATRLQPPFSVVHPVHWRVAYVRVASGCDRHYGCQTLILSRRRGAGVCRAGRAGTAAVEWEDHAWRWQIHQSGANLDTWLVFVHSMQQYL